MRSAVTVLVCAIGIIVMLAASEVLVRGLSRLGVKLAFSAALLGLVTALGADAPEISSAVSALASGARDVGFGVIVGSNIFNLAALLGVPAIMSGHLRTPRGPLLLDGGVSLLMTLAVGAWVLAWVSAPVVAAILFVIFAAYLMVLAASPARIDRWPLPERVRAAAVRAATAVRPLPSPVWDERLELSPKQRSWLPVSFVPASLGAIVAGSAITVHAALDLASQWHVSNVIVGTIALAGITGLPNAYAAIRLSLEGRGSAVVSEAFNSNAINLLIGIGVPALITSGSPARAGMLADLLWLVGLTLLTLAMTGNRDGLYRIEGMIVIAGYLAFVAFKFAG